MIRDYLRVSIIVFFITMTCTFCVCKQNDQDGIIIGSERLDKYLNLLKDKRVAMVVNHTSLINSIHLVDTLTTLGIHIDKIFVPEHGFRGEADAGESIDSEIDNRTGIRIISLYGESVKPAKSDMAGLDIIVFDIQDVGVRFYTYISTMHYVMEACAENNIDFLVLDKPNPNGFYIDGPVLDVKYKSFVGLHPVPLVYGMTIGEYAQMINGEGWLKNGIKAKLTVITCENYTHNSHYILPVKPSPNLPNMQSVYLYPSLGLFEGTIVSVGRGTDIPFQVFGHPDFKSTEFSFTPVSNKGAKNPKYKDQLCYGIDLTMFDIQKQLDLRIINLQWLLLAYYNLSSKDFFNSFFPYLSGNNKLHQQVKEGYSESEIRESWEEDLERFKEIRKKYLLYEDVLEGINIKKQKS